jgi:hypothetical protein
VRRLILERREFNYCTGTDIKVVRISNTVGGHGVFPRAPDLSARSRSIVV